MDIVKSLSEFMSSKLSAYIYDEKKFLDFNCVEIISPQKYMREKPSEIIERIEIIIGLSDDFLLGRLAPILYHIDRDPKNKVVLADQEPPNLEDNTAKMMVRS